MEKACCGGKDTEEGRLIGDYVLGPRIGWGSFAVVWKSRHRQTGMEVAIKEIDKRHLLSTRDNLLKEISILSNIRHPNIICLFQAIQTEDRIYLVLEYCDGGDLAAYIHRHGKVSETLARHFMRQLAAGLQVLNENRLIHRDLKPQNLLLSNTEATPLLKIGDFGFARYLTAQGLADTLCGSPLYMAPEIIQNKKYDGKADLWSAGAILYQLVTGKPPFDGDTHLQLFQNILTSSELQFCQYALEQLHPDCVNLCRGLLRRNPVERLTFEEFFNHKFLTEIVDPNVFNSFTNYHKIKHERRHANSSSSKIDHGNTSDSNDIQSFMSNIVIEQPRNHLKVTDSLDSIEKDYVLVNAHFTSMETFSCSLDKSMLSGSASGVFSCLPLKGDLNVGLTMQPEDQVDVSSYRSKNLQNDEEALLELPSTALLTEVEGLPLVHPQTKFQLLYKYIYILSELAQMKFNAGLYLESFSVELVILAIWKEALKVCSSWLAYIVEDDFCENSSPDRCIYTKGNATASSNSRKSVDFIRHQSISLWAEQEFIAAFDRVEKLSHHVKTLDGSVKMPDAMEVIFQTALEVGKSGGVDELMGNKSTAAVAYSKAKLLMSFILGEAALLPLNPPFSLSPADRERIKGYIANFESRESIFQLSKLFH